METKSIITDRHPQARTALLTPTFSAPAVGATICDPTFNTAITRITPNGFSLTSDSFSVGGGWVMGIGPSGNLVAFALDASTGKPQLVNGQNRMVPLSYELVPQSPGGSICTVSGAFWSSREEGVVYLVGCGTRLFKYNLALYNSARPLAGLVAGTNSRSIASWPPCTMGNCRQGPVFMNFDDLFGSYANNGFTAFLTVSVSDNDTTFAGFLTRHEGYKNVAGMFVYRPGTNSLWSSVSGSTAATSPLMATGSFNGTVVNRRVIGTQTDRSGRYMSMAVCNDSILNVYLCGTASAYVFDLNLVSPRSTLAATNPNGLDQLTHGSMGTGLRVGSNGLTQHLAASYLTSPSEKKLLSLPDLSNPNGWWGSYTETGYINGSSGYPLASVHSTYSYERSGAYINNIGSCPARYCLYGNELMLFNTSGTRFIRLAHNQSRIDDYGVAAYWDLPRASISRNGKYVIFVSNWGTPSTTTTPNYAVYLARVPAAWRMLLDDSITVNTSATMVPPGAYTVLTVSHMRSTSGANVLLQDSSQSAANRATACLFQVNRARQAQLANDSGVFTNSMRGPIGSPSAGIMENSRCGIDLSRSTVDYTSNGNVIYKMSVYYKVAFLNKTIRAIAQPTGASSWTDGTKFDVRAWAFSWVVPTSGGSRSDEEADAEPSVTEYRSNEPLRAGASLEVPIEDPQPFRLKLTDDHYSNVTVRIFRDEQGDSRLEVLEDTTATGTAAAIKPGALVRVDYREDGRLAILVDGVEVAVVYGPASRGGLYLVTDRINSQIRIAGADQPQQ